MPDVASVPHCRCPNVVAVVGIAAPVTANEMRVRALSAQVPIVLLNVVLEDHGRCLQISRQARVRTERWRAQASMAVHALLESHCRIREDGAAFLARFCILECLVIC